MVNVMRDLSSWERRVSNFDFISSVGGISSLDRVNHPSRDISVGVDFRGQSGEQKSLVGLFLVEVGAS